MPPIQQRFDEESISREEWTWVEDLITDVAREEQSGLFAQKLFQWDLAVKQFRKIEMKRIILGTPGTIDLHFHALCLHGLLAIGRALIIDSKRFTSEELTKFQIKHEEIEAYVEELGQSLREWHHGFNDAELKRVRETVFGAKA
ncbi:MAG: hypothetical protein ABMA01_16195 [Chthoniobacteraceae bacterium]